jgi:amidase/aspartyl-tRNA(Asn)/glutamyl-tRNA(Gln) amidotransferase subunit A
MLIDDFCKVFEDYDILLSPVTTCLPVENAGVKGETKGPEGHEQLIGFCETFMYNMTGNPAASVPVGFSIEGLPLAVQVAGPRFGDEEVLQVSHVIEQLNK